MNEDKSQKSLKVRFPLAFAISFILVSLIFWHVQNGNYYGARLSVPSGENSVAIAFNSVVMTVIWLLGLWIWLPRIQRYIAVLLNIEQTQIDTREKMAELMMKFSISQFAAYVIQYWLSSADSTIGFVFSVFAVLVLSYFNIREMFNIFNADLGTSLSKRTLIMVVKLMAFLLVVVFPSLALLWAFAAFIFLSHYFRIFGLAQAPYLRKCGNRSARYTPN